MTAARRRLPFRHPHSLAQSRPLGHGRGPWFQYFYLPFI